jgi:hypothetical protein
LRELRFDLFDAASTPDCLPRLGPLRIDLQSQRNALRNVIVHVIDGTYELFRHFYGLRRFVKGKRSSEC